MVYRSAARKTAGYLVLASVLSLSVVTFLSGDLEPTGRVVDAAQGGSVSGTSWLGFALGLVTGALIVGTYVYVAHLEAKKR